MESWLKNENYESSEGKIGTDWGDVYFSISLIIKIAFPAVIGN